MAFPPPILQAAHRVNRQLTTYFHRLQVVTPCTVPAQGPAILVANHIGYLDPVLLQGACPRVITWMVATDFYHLPILHWFFRGIGAIPVQRSGRDLAATRAALRALARGQVIGLFPEGRIEPKRELLPFQTGAALLAARTGAPLVPVALEGTQRDRPLLEALLTPQSARVAFGSPVTWSAHDPSRQELEKITEQIQVAVRTLLKDILGESL